jgi:SAM-dependent methyltransferase
MAAPRFRVSTMVTLLAQHHPRTLMDLGCGGGQFLEELARALPSTRLAGADLSETQITSNRASMPGATFFAVDLDVPDAFEGSLGTHVASFDAVVAMELIEHVADPRALLLNARRLASRGGRLFLSTQSGTLRETERRVGHRRHFTASEMRTLLIDTGWKPQHIWNCGFPFHNLSKRIANLNPDAALERFDDRSYGPVENALCFTLRALFRLNSHTHGAQLFAVAQNGF